MEVLSKLSLIGESTPLDSVNPILWRLFIEVSGASLTGPRRGYGDQIAVTSQCLEEYLNELRMYMFSDFITPDEIECPLKSDGLVKIGTHDEPLHGR